MNTYLITSSFITFLSAMVLVTFLAASNQRHPVRRSYLYFLITITAWSGAYVMWQLSVDARSAVVYCNILIAASTLIPITFYQFALTLVGVKSFRLLVLGYVFAILIIASIPFGFVVDGVSAKFGHAFWPNAGILMPYYLVFYSAYLFISGYVLLSGWKRHLGSRASDYMFVFVSGLVGYAGGVTNFPLWYDIPIQPYGNALVGVYILIVGYGLYHKRVAGIHLDVYKACVGLLLNVSMAVFYLMALALYRSFNDEVLSGTDILVEGAVAFTVSSLVFWGVPRFKFWVERILGDVFRQEQNSALSGLKDLPSKLADISDDQSIAQLTGECLMETFEVSGVAIYRLVDFENHYRCVYSVGEFITDPQTYPIRTDSPFIEGLLQQPKCLILDQLYEGINEDYYESLVQLNRDLKASVVVPIYVEHEVYGLIFLGATPQARMWTEEEEVVLFNVGAQIGLNLRTRALERRANEVDKLVALGTMAAGLSHEIRNPLVSVQTLASLIQMGRSLDSVSPDFKDVLLRDVKRIGNIVEGVALYSQNQQSRKGLVSIVSVVQASLDIYKDALNSAEVTVDFDPEEHPEMMVLGSIDALMQVFNNLIENAMHALARVDAPLLKVRIHSRKGGGSQPWLEVSFSDNGSGIPQSILGRIFDPFTTSKDTGKREDKIGLGLGLAISKRIIDNHDGVITASNQKDGGAKFVVSLKISNPKESNV